ncbi:MAG: hypothetical protein Q4P15_04060 [Propionibacteriaceae bacterium]|nr:hypothetical protein [Propionibacteriaceae bacterium]
MTRELSSWTRTSSAKRAPRITWPGDMLAFAGTLFGLRTRRPHSAPPRESEPRDRLSRSDLRRIPDIFNMLAWRVDYQVMGIDALTGLEAPVVFAVNEQGPLDWQVLRLVLPPRLRTTHRRLSRALSQGRSVAVFTDDPLVPDQVGDFTTVAADLATQYSIPIVPVALGGTFKLKEILRLTLKSKPKVWVCFGAPIYVHGRSLGGTTAEVQAAVGELFQAEHLSWWAVQRGAAAPACRAEAMPRWRRLWGQTSPREQPQHNLWR